MRKIVSKIGLLITICSFSVFAGNAGIIEVNGTITKIIDLKKTPCEMTSYQYYVSGDYLLNGVIKNFGSCFESVAVPLIGSQDHGGSPTGNILTDALVTLDNLSGKPVKMTFTVYDTKKLTGGLQTMLSIELRKPTTK